MSNSIPALPPIKKKHRLNIEKAKNQIHENYLSCRDTAVTNISYRITEHNDKDVKKKNK